MYPSYFSVSADPSIDREHAESAERTRQMACEAFGDGMVPKLETAVYKVGDGGGISDKSQVMILTITWLRSLSLLLSSK